MQIMNTFGNFGNQNMVAQQAYPQYELQNCEDRIRKAYEQAIAQMHASDANLTYCRQLEVKIAYQEKHVYEQIKLLTQEFAYARVSAVYNKLVLETIQQNSTPIELLRQRCDELYYRPTPVIADAVLKKCWYQLDKLGKRPK